MVCFTRFVQGMSLQTDRDYLTTTSPVEAEIPIIDQSDSRYLRDSLSQAHLHPKLNTCAKILAQFKFQITFQKLHQ